MNRFNDQKVTFTLLHRALCAALGALLAAGVLFFCSSCTQANAANPDAEQTGGSSGTLAAEQTDAVSEAPVTEQTDAAEQSETPAESDAPAEEEMLSVRDTPGNVIIINELTAEQADALNSRAWSLPAILSEDIVEMERSELLAYYGIEELDLAGILDGFEESAEEWYDIESGYGMITGKHRGDDSDWFSSPFKWVNKAANQSVSVEFSLGSLPFFVGFERTEDGTWVAGNLAGLQEDGTWVAGNWGGEDAGPWEPSTISGVEVLIYSWVSESGRTVYGAEFLTNGVGAEIDGNTEEDDFLGVIAYVISALQV